MIGVLENVHTEQAFIVAFKHELGETSKQGKISTANTIFFAQY